MVHRGRVEGRVGCTRAWKSLRWTMCGREGWSEGTPGKEKKGRHTMERKGEVGARCVILIVLIKGGLCKSSCSNTDNEYPEWSENYPEQECIVVGGRVQYIPKHP